MKLKHVVSPLVAMLPSLALPYTPYLSCLPPLETAFLSFRPPTGNRVLKFEAPYSCENGLHCLNHPPFPSFVCSGPENARSLVIGDPNLTCSWFINVGVVFTYLSVYERNEEKRNCTKRKFSAQISFPEMMKGSSVSVPSLLSKTLESVSSYIPSSLPRRKRVPPMVYSKVEETDCGSDQSIPFFREDLWNRKAKTDLSKQIYSK